MTWESLQLPLAQLKLASESNLSQDHSCRIGWRFCLDERCERILQPTHHPISANHRDSTSRGVARCGLHGRLPIHSQASSPRSVALAQLPSPRACSLEVIIWYTGLLEIPISHRGLKPHKLMPMTGVPIGCSEVADRPISDGTHTPATR